MRVWLILAVLSLTACSTTKPFPNPDLGQEFFDLRRDALSAAESWAMVSRLGVDAGSDGGSGRLEWVRNGATHELNFRGALGRGAWRLTLTGDGATLDRGEAGIVSAQSVDDLIYGETGWQIPVEALVWWVRGLSWPQGPEPDRLTLNEDGTPAILAQAGWVIEYGRYDESPWKLPVRLEARRQEVGVKLAIRQWQMDAAELQHGGR